MLRTRIITALILAAGFCFALFVLPPLGWLIFVIAVTAVAAWEWGALMLLGGAARLLLGALFVVLCVLIAACEPAAVGIGDGFADAAWRLGAWIYLPAAAFWLLVVPFWLRQRWGASGSLGVLTGALLLLPAWLALVQLRQAGPGALLAVMLVVWLADIGAYFVGRGFGRHKLAPTISPGKTWEGALGGGVVVLVYGFLLSPILPAGLAGNFWLIGLLFAALTAISILGDLFESLLKRQAGLKDSSNVLPGHGGLLDRIDSLTSTLPLVALIWLLTPR